jgi:hypothetical protein
MAVAKMSKFTVPTADGSNGLLMPKLKYRFRALFTGFGLTDGQTELTRQVVDIKRPNVNFNPITIDVYNSKVYLQGKPEWQDITVNLRDSATGEISKKVGQQVQKQFDFLEQASAAAGGDYKFSLNFQMLDGSNGAGEPTVLEEWELSGCFLSQVDWGDMAYSSNDPVQIALTVKYDNALQITGSAVGGGVGGPGFGSGGTTTTITSP